MPVADAGGLCYAADCSMHPHGACNSPCPAHLCHTHIPTQRTLHLNLLYNSTLKHVGRVSA